MNNRVITLSGFKRHAQSGLFFALSVIQYIAYYVTIASFFQEIIGNFAAVVCLVLTYIFRIDILAASVGFWGIWKVWHAPLWVAVVLTVSFLTLSILTKHWPGTKTRTFFERITSRKGKTS